MLHRRVPGLLSIALLLLLAVPLFAQIDKAAVDAVALDQNRAALPGVTVTVVRPETGYQATSVTDVAGLAHFTALAPGNYELSFTLEGFAPVKAQKLTLLVGQTAKIAVTMKQAASETITVTAAAPMVDIHKSDSSTNIIPEQIESLPVADRDFQRLAFIAPGVQRERGGYRFIGGGPVIGSGGNASQATILVDGVDFTDPALGLSRVRFSQDAIREFRVIQDRFDTEIGGSAGGALSIVTKSGTNDLHGNVFGFFRDNSLRAKGALEQKKNPYSRQQFGFTVGGPIVRDKTFYFGSAEHINENNIALFRPVGATYGNLAADVKVPFNQTLLFGSLDTQFTPAMAGGVRATYEKFAQENFRVGGVADISSGQKLERKNWNVIGENSWSISSLSSNEARMQYGSRRYFEPTNSSAVGEYFSSGNTLITGSNILGDLLGEGTEWELRDTFHHQLTIGSSSHALKAGISAQHVNDRSRIDTYQNGLFIYATDTRAIPILYVYGVGSSDIRAKTNLYGAFVEDSWTPNPKTTVNLGLRYDLDTNGNDPGFRHPLVPNGRERDTNNFQPRFSFNYDLAGNGANVIRGGLGRFTGRFLLVPLFTELQQNGVTGRITLQRLNGAVYGYPQAYWLDPAHPTTTGIPLPAAISLLSPTLKSPESDQASLGWTTRLGGSRMFLDTEAIYVKGKDELSVRDTNWAGNATAKRLNPAYDQINMYTNQGHSKYKALVFSLNGNVRQNDLLTASVTFSDKKNISDDFSPALTDYPSDPANINAEYGRARGSERYHIVLTGVFHAPWALTVAPIYEYGSGQPWSQRYGYDYNGDGKSSDRVAGVGRNTMDGPAFRQLSLRVTKAVPMSGNGQLEVIAEAFNLTNVKNYDVNSINSALYLSGPTIASPKATAVANPNYGKAFATLPAREIQLGLRFVY